MVGWVADVDDELADDPVETRASWVGAAASSRPERCPLTRCWPGSMRAGITDEPGGIAQQEDTKSSSCFDPVHRNGTTDGAPGLE